MGKYYSNKADAVFFNTQPTMTDQSQAANTDINVIINNFLRTGQAPVGQEGIFADFSQLPEDLRGFIEMGRSLTGLHNQLPEQLRGIPAEKLISMTNDEINAILKPDDKPKEETK